LYNILTECDISMKLIRQIKMCLNITCSTVQVGKHLSDMFPIKNGFKQGSGIPRGVWGVLTPPPPPEIPKF
jgi:hypothetical protein